jgi:2-amino-4-hydroxy-6-hydroxymethyldihydropteridine diphosphokinase
MNKAYLLTGGNMGNREKTLGKALTLIHKYCGNISAQSSIYETAAWGKTDQSSFLNQALELETDQPPRLLLRQLLKIETEIGRVREGKIWPANY